MSILGRQDPDSGAIAPDRVHYTTGMLLDREDFRTDQAYHSGRLARSLSALFGHGTVGGLKVEVEQGDDLHLLVRAGLAIDPLGRLIELPQDHCLRLDRWWQAILSEDGGVNTLLAAFDNANDVVIADVFLRFETCERGLRPAFASGNRDALDAVQPSRIRDGYQLDLVLRDEDTPPLPESGLPVTTGDAGADRSALNNDKLDRPWSTIAPQQALDGSWGRGPEHRLEQDGSEVFVARIRVPFTFSPDPARIGSQPVQIDNGSRRFVYATNELAWLLSL